MNRGLSIPKIVAAVRNGELDPVRLVETALESLTSPRHAHGAVISLNQDAALAAAKDVATRRTAGEHLRLAGLLFAVKDNIAVAGYPLTCAAPLLRDHHPTEDATAVAALRAAGAVAVAKTNLDAFGMGSTGTHSCFGPTTNPHAPDRSAGGSSAGSAALVGAGLLPLALGSDTGGSVRLPAAFCGAVGFKPSYGRVSRSGLVAHASSLDVIGTLTTSVRDALEVLRVLIEGDGKDATHQPMSLTEPTLTSPLHLGVPPLETGDIAPTRAVREAFEETVRRLRAAGVRVSSVALPRSSASLSTYAIVAAVEAASNLARFDGVRYGTSEGGGDPVATTRGASLGEEVVKRILLGTFCQARDNVAAWYGRACRARRLVVEDYREALTGIDALLTPTAPAPPPRLTEITPIKERSLDGYTVGPSLAGLPALSIPAGSHDVGGDCLPFGVQLIGRHFEDEHLLAVGALIESGLAEDSSS